MYNPSIDWNELNGISYSKSEVYRMSWNVDLERYVVVAAPFGGPLALAQDDKKILLVNQGSLKPQIQIYSSSGTPISSFTWERGKLVGMGWSEQEKLICVVEDGSVLVYTVMGELAYQFSLGADCKEHGVIDCKIWGGGLVCLTGDYQLIAVTNLLEPRARKLAETGLINPPSSWVVIEPQFTLSTNVEVLLATGRTVFLVDSSSVQDQLITNGPFSKMALSPNGKFLACFTETGVLWVVSSDFSKNMSQFDTKSKVPPDQMVWCGTDTVLLFWKDVTLLMVGPSGEWIKYSYDGPIVLVPECDGVRIISRETCDMLRRVPACTEDIFKIGSTAPSSLLYDALDHFEKKSPKADENIRSIKDKLTEAVNSCIEAATFELSYSVQKTLLRAVSFGKCFLDSYDCKNFVETCKTLRILNSVNHYEIGIPITFSQYKQLGPMGLIDRLVNAHHHLLALRVCEYLKIPGDRVLVDWACKKVKQKSYSDTDISALIVKKLENVPGISYAEIASTAWAAGRIELATRLLDFEPRAADQVPLLISMHQDELALAKAIESGDTDLVFLVVLHIKRSRPPSDFFKIIRNEPVALDLLIAYCKQQDLKLLKDLYFQFEQPQETANIAVLEAYRNPDLDNRIAGLQEALALYSQSKDTFSMKATEDQIKLLLVQSDLEATLGEKFLDLSLNDTIFALIAKGHHKRAIKIRTDFKVPDKHFWWLKVKALASVGDWINLEKFCKEKKPPIGYGPFAQVCIEANQLREAEKYVPKIQDPAEKVSYFIILGYYMEAVEVARSAKNNNLLVTIRNKCNDREVIAIIDKLLPSDA